ncbi:darcynin family protein [Burkholderia cenocepacia]|uniref:darcynin family protein n=1 Tax=Burkholderia cenocepacia TaxID=95486 RepID=UPI0021180DB2|nr:darcynin family protein [Burkholderia cenocepacia]
MFMRVDTHAEWRKRGRRRPRDAHVEPIPTTLGERTSPYRRGTGFYTARVTDVRVRYAQGRRADELAGDAPSEKPFPDRNVGRVDRLPGIENARAPRNGDAASFTGRATHSTRTSNASLAHAQSFFPPHPQEKTTVATCGTTVVVRDATVTLWA